MVLDWLLVIKGTIVGFVITRYSLLLYGIYTYTHKYVRFQISSPYIAIDSVLHLQVGSVSTNNIFCLVCWMNSNYRRRKHFLFTLFGWSSYLSDHGVRNLQLFAGLQKPRLPAPASPIDQLGNTSVSLQSSEFGVKLSCLIVQRKSSFPEYHPSSIRTQMSATRLLHPLQPCRPRIEP